MVLLTPPATLARSRNSSVNSQIKTQEETIHVRHEHICEILKNGHFLATIFDREWRSYRGPTSGKCYIDTSLLDFDFRIWKNICAFENIYLKTKNSKFLMNLQIFFAKHFLSF